ncbi:phosphodiester glycosidase family protein [Amycolatopsis sp. RTGN1]|uniref:phosphodiester glycosidase family protein n=1 Tax=Amycolatopsis ponsaeliensis TaxID=2992142 RepID=UPI00254CE9E6|nr:phosphodiester glycosidase family protein [Amycolatopsis sp. RTGN1]
MAMTALPFSGPTFFRDIRARLQADRGMFVGSDGAYRYVCVDPGFYRLGVFVRPTSSTFTASAKTATAGTPVRAVANGQVFDDYQFTSPGPVAWQGEVISGGAVLPGGGAAGSAPMHRYAAQWPGISVPALAFGTGSPSTVVPPLRSAFGRLVPLIEAGARATAAQLGSWMTKGARTGKTVYGLCAAEAVLFVLVQEHGTFLAPTGAETVTDLMTRLFGMGVDQAMLADGSDSVALLVDGTTLVTPAGYKDNSIPVGPSLELHGLQLTATSSLVLTGSTDPQFAGSLQLAGVRAALRLTAPGAGLVLEDLGTPSSGTADQVRNGLGLTLPMSMAAADAPPRPSEPFLFIGGNVQARLLLSPEQTTDGRITGSMQVTTPRGQVDFDVLWDLEDLP